jgi:hypothetical protein
MRQSADKALDIEPKIVRNHLIHCHPSWIAAWANELTVHFFSTLRSDRNLSKCLNFNPSFRAEEVKNIEENLTLFYAFQHDSIAAARVCQLLQGVNMQNSDFPLGKTFTSALYLLGYFSPFSLQYSDFWHEILSSLALEEIITALAIIDYEFSTTLERSLQPLHDCNPLVKNNPENLKILKKLSGVIKFTHEESRTPYWRNHTHPIAPKANSEEIQAHLLTLLLLSNKFGAGHIVLIYCLGEAEKKNKDHIRHIDNVVSTRENVSEKCIADNITMFNTVLHKMGLALKEHNTGFLPRFHAQGTSPNNTLLDNLADAPRNRTSPSI